MYLLTPQLWPALALFLLLALPMVVTDARESRLPLPLNLGLLGAGAVALPITAAWVGFDHLIWAAVSCGIATVLMLVLFVISRGGLGFGDVILVAALTFYGGFVSPLASGWAASALWGGSSFGVDEASADTSPSVPA